MEDRLKRQINVGDIVALHPKHLNNVEDVLVARVQGGGPQLLRVAVVMTIDVHPDEVLVVEPTTVSVMDPKLTETGEPERVVPLNEGQGVE